MSLSRRLVLAAPLALAACKVKGQPPAAGPLAPLKSLAPFPMGTCVQAAQLQDPAFADLIAQQFSQLTPEWEMKMEYIVGPDGRLRFDRGDAIAGFAHERGMRFFGTTLVWYAQKPDAWTGLDNAAFARTFDGYLRTVVGRYQGQAVGWDTVNEPVAEDGHGWRTSLWSERLGDFDHMVRAFKVARESDPDAVLFINDYNLETIPAKLDTFLKLIDRLLKAGAPVGGVGCQTHIAADLAPGVLTKTLKALARFGLPIHVSEMDVSLVRAGGLLKSRAELETGQARLYGEMVEAFAALPEAQQFAFTVWGARDKDSWLKRENASDTPLLFDDAGRPKAAARAVAAALGG